MDGRARRAGTRYALPARRYFQGVSLRTPAWEVAWGYSRRDLGRLGRDGRGRLQTEARGERTANRAKSDGHRWAEKRGAPGSRVLRRGTQERCYGRQGSVHTGP